MATTQEATTAPPKIRLEMPTSGLAKWSTVGRVLQDFARRFGIRLEIDGAEEGGQTAEGLYFKIRPGTATKAPWQGRPAGAGIEVVGGYVNGLAVGNSAIGGGVGVCWLRLNFDLDVEDGFVYSADLQAASIQSGSSMPGDDGTSGIFNVPLFAFSGSTIIQSASRFIYVSACDDGSGEGRAALIVHQS